MTTIDDVNVSSQPHSPSPSIHLMDNPRASPSPSIHLMDNPRASPAGSVHRIDTPQHSPARIVRNLIDIDIPQLVAETTGTPQELSLHSIQFSIKNKEQIFILIGFIIIIIFLILSLIFNSLSTKYIDSNNLDYAETWARNSAIISGIAVGIILITMNIYFIAKFCNKINIK